MLKATLHESISLPTDIIQIIIEYLRHKAIEGVRSKFVSRSLAACDVATTSDLIAVCDYNSPQITLWKDVDPFPERPLLGISARKRPSQPQDPKSASDYGQNCSFHCSITIAKEELYLSNLKYQDIEIYNITTGKFLRCIGNTESKHPLTSPKGITIVGNELFVLEGKGNESLVSVFNRSTGLYLRSWGGKEGDKEGVFNFGYETWGASVREDEDDLFIVDTNHQLVHVYNPLTGNLKRKFGGRPDLSNPRGIAPSGGWVYVSDYNKDTVTVWSREGQLRTSWETSGEGLGGMIMSERSELIVTSSYRLGGLLFFK